MSIQKRSSSKQDKILVVAPCPFPIDRGTPIRIRRLAEMMSDEFEVHVATFFPGQDEDSSFRIHRTPRIPLEITRSGANIAKLIYDFLLLVKVIQVVRREGIRVIDGHLHEGAFIGLLARAMTRAQVIYNAHGTFVPELIATGAIGNRSILIRPLSWFERWIERRVDRIVAQSKLRRDEFISAGLSVDKVVVVEDVPELDKLLVRDENVDSRLAEKLRPNGEKLLIYSGGMEPYQGVDFLLRGFQEIRRTRNDVRLVLFGRPLEDYRSIVEQMGLSNHVVFVDHEPFSRLPQYLKICDIGFALRLYGENVPGKLPIYLASGIAVVGTDLKGINSVIEHGYSGFLTKPDDDSALVALVNQLLDTPELVSKVGRQGRQEALDRYSVDQIRLELGNLYRTLLGENR